MRRKEDCVMEDDKLRAVLRAWEAPEPDPEMDARVRAAWRALHPAGWKRTWKRIWTARVSVPVPVLAALLLIAAFLLVKFGALACLLNLFTLTWLLADIDDGLDLEIFIDQAHMPAHCDVAMIGRRRRQAGRQIRRRGANFIA
jgi:hypothetical protein